MNQVVYNNRVFYFDSARYSPPQYNNFHNVLQTVPQNIQVINNYYSENSGKEPKNIKLTIVLPKKVKEKIKETVAGKGYVAAKFLNKVR